VEAALCQGQYREWVRTPSRINRLCCFVKYARGVNTFPYSLTPFPERRKKQFDKLTDEEIAKMENVFREIFNIPKANKDV
jgi:hypothetical protein